MKATEITVLEEVESSLGENVKVCKVNVDEQMDLATQYKVDVIPTLFFFKDGKQVKKTVGVVDKNQIVSVPLHNSHPKDQVQQSIFFYLYLRSFWVSPHWFYISVCGAKVPATFSWSHSLLSSSSIFVPSAVSVEPSISM